MFKTESVIVPAFLDAVTGAEWMRGMLRGFLPVLNRLGQSVPPVLLADFVRQFPLKKRLLAGFTFLMGFPFAVLAALLWGGPTRYLPLTFLGLYLAFACCYGLYLLAFSTLQGKLIEPGRRGYLLSASTFWGSIPAIGIALWLMPGWLAPPAPHFTHLFLFVAVCFMLAAGIGLLAAEPREQLPRGSPRVPGGLAQLTASLRTDGNLRVLVFVAMLFGSSLILAPHYQALARERLGLADIHLMTWIITQSVSVGIFSLFVGRVADYEGNRLSVRLLIFGAALAPAMAVALANLPDSLGKALYWTVFIPLGFSPLVLRILVNYTLEVCKSSRHARYVSTVNLFLAIPFLFSPLAGWTIDLVGFESVFLGAAVLTGLAGCLTFALEEPRRRASIEELRSVEVSDAE